MIFSTLFVVFYGLMAIISKNRLIIQQRLDQIRSIDTKQSERSETGRISLTERAIKPMFDHLYALVAKTMSEKKRNQLISKLDLAGLLKNSTVEEWLLKKWGIVLLFSIFMGLLVTMGSGNGTNGFLIFILSFFLMMYFFRFYLVSRMDGRKRSILRNLPFTLDLITISVEAGTSFDGAMMRVINNVEGPLTEEFSKALKEMRMGVPRDQALRSMSDRCQVKELSTLVSSLIQADKMGVALGKILTIEAENLREHFQQMAREKAMKAPVKMLIPMVFFIFPSIFVIILGPTVLRVLEIFKM